MTQGPGNIDLNSVHQFAAQNQGQLKNAVSSNDGQRVRDMLQGDSDQLRHALHTGDIGTLKNKFDSLMQTPEGSRLIQQIGQMIQQ